MEEHRPGRREDGQPSVGLCMIVRDEAHVIRRCLASVRPLLDAWCIVDTGSTDDTMQVVEEVMGDLPGALHARSWQNFAHNRNEALALARPWADYLLVIDADDTLTLASDYKLPTLVRDGYYTVHRLAGSATSYYRLQLVKAAAPWRYVGAVHEVLVCDGPHDSEKLEEFVCVSHHDGARNAGDPREKYARDVALLKAAVADDPTDARSVFYLAQSQRDAGQRDDAIESYLRRAAMGGWNEEVFQALFQAGRLHLQAGREPEGLEALLAAYETRPSRAESLVELAHHHRSERRFHLAKLYAAAAVAIERPDDLLFIDESVYAYRAEDELAVAAYWTGAYACSLACSERILEAGSVPEEHRRRVEQNRRFALEKLAAATPKVAVEASASRAPLTTRVRYEACPLCESDELQPERIGDARHHPRYHPSLDASMRWLRCARCSHVFVEGYFTEDAAALVFAESNPGQRPGFADHGSRRIAGTMVDTVVRARGGATSGRWLDVGFGSGVLMTVAEEYGHRVVGMEARDDVVQTMRDHGYDVHVGELADYAGEGGFDVISMADVLEHMAFPKPALRRAHEILNAEGVLFVSMPNSDTFAWRRLDEEGKNPYWGELEHLHNFSRRRLYALLDEHGFEPVHYGISERYVLCMEVIAKKR